MAHLPTHANDTGMPKTEAERQSLPVPMHPDDAKDKVFVAIIKALLRLRNKPSSPKELANAVMKYKYATLGGATPYATVSSRISQHFKRAATHSPPRSPLLIKHYDPHHSRRIYYSLAASPPPSQRSPSLSDNDVEEHVTSPVPCSTNAPSRFSAKPSLPPSPTSLPQSRHGLYESESDDEDHSQYDPKYVRRRTKSSSPPLFLLQRRRQGQHENKNESDNEDLQLDQKRVLGRYYVGPLSPTTESPSVSSSSSSSSCDETSSDEREYPQQNLTMPNVPLSAMTSLSDDSENDEDDYHEEMLRGDDEMIDFEHPSSASMRRPSIAQATVCEDRTRPDLGSSQYQPSQPSHPLEVNYNGFNNDLWAMDYDTDFNSVFLVDDATATATATPSSFDNMASPESIPISDLDIYFDGDCSHGDQSAAPASQPLPTATRTTARRNISALAGSREHSLCHRAKASTPAAAAAAAAETSTQIQDEDIGFTRPQSKSRPRHGCQSEELGFLEETAASTTAIGNSTKRPPLSATYLNKEKSKDYSITKKTLGSLECYELHTHNRIPNIKILRFIASTDGATEHVALRTRRASDTRNKNRSTNQHVYLAKGYVNATQMRRAARPTLGKGTFETSSEVDQGHAVVNLTCGTIECRGAWVPLGRARELASEYKLDDVPGLAKLLSDDPSDVDQENKEEVTLAETPFSLSTKKNKPSFVKYEGNEARKMTDATNTFALDESFLAPSNATASLETDPRVPKLTVNKPDAVNTVLPKSIASIPGSDFTKALVPHVQSTSRLDIPPQALASSPESEPLHFPKHPPPSGSPVRSVNIDRSHAHPIHTLVPTNPPMYIVVVDNVLVCVAVLGPTEAVPTECRIMRRLDTDYINGTMLLTASGIDSESERSMILSLEMDRRRVSMRKSSGLCGTWIPLRRARELAVTHSIQCRLGPFLDDAINSYFPSRLRLPTPAAVANKNNKHPAVSTSFLPRHGLLYETVPPTDGTAATGVSPQLSIGYFLTEPVLDPFDCAEGVHPCSVATVVPASVAARVADMKKRQRQGLSSDEDMDTDTDAKQDRQRKDDQAMEALEEDLSMDLNEHQPLNTPRPLTDTFWHGQSTIKSTKFGLKRPNHTKTPSRSFRDSTPSKKLQDAKQLQVTRIPSSSSSRPTHSRISSSKDRNAGQGFGYKHDLPAPSIRSQGPYMIYENDEGDEEIDIGGSDSDDDLR